MTMYRIMVYRNKSNIISFGNLSFSEMCEYCDMIPWHENGPYLVSIQRDGQFYSDFKTNRIPQCVPLTNSYRSSPPNPAP